MNPILNDDLKFKNNPPCYIPNLDPDHNSNHDSNTTAGSQKILSASIRSLIGHKVVGLEVTGDKCGRQDIMVPNDRVLDRMFIIGLHIQIGSSINCWTKQRLVQRISHKHSNDIPGIPSQHSMVIHYAHVLKLLLKLVNTKIFMNVYCWTTPTKSTNYFIFSCHESS